MPSQPPTPYDRNFNFTEFGQIYPTKPLPGNQVDIELNDVQLSINGTITRLNLIQNDDGTLKIPGSLPWYQQFLINVADANNAKNLAVDAAASAAESADLAGTSELDAYTHAQAAQASAGEALSSSQAASASADAAGASASGASTYATMAGNSEAAAATSASEAAGYAQIVNPANYIPQPTIPAVDGQILAFNGTDWVALDNYAQVLQETVRNETGATLAKGTVVYVYGASGNKPLVEKAQGSSEAASSRTFAVLAADIANNNNGNAVTSGLLRGLDLSAYTAGAPLWLSPTVPGGFTPTKPVAPDHAVFVGWVVRAHQTQGELLVKIQNGYELGELHDVSLPSPLDGEVLKFEAGTGLWKSAPANPFDQSLNIGEPVSFGSVTITDLSANLTLNGGIVFSDATMQDTAGLSPADAAATYYPLTNPAGYISSAPAVVDVQTFGGPTSSGSFTWTKPAGAKMVEVFMIGAGGGGGSGARNTTSNSRGGGGGGGGGGFAKVLLNADLLPSSVTVQVGAGGAGGASRTSSNQAGANGVGGTLTVVSTTFGSLRCQGGNAGSGGSIIGGVGTNGSAAIGHIDAMLSVTMANAGGNGQSTGSGASAGTLSGGLVQPTGGGGGAGSNVSTPLLRNGGAGGSRTTASAPFAISPALAGGAGGTASPLAPATNGVDQDFSQAGGTGGGGGYYVTGMNGGDGADGGWPGGAGGGGGGADDPFASGAGGKGANGMVRITTYF